MLIHTHRRLPLAYAVAVGAVLAVAALRWALDPVLGDIAPLILFLLPVAFSARFGGFGPGCVATLLSVVLGVTLFGAFGKRPPPPPTTAHTIFRAIPFVLVGTLISAFAAGLEAARVQAEEQKQQARDNEEFLRRVLASSPDCVKVLDLQGKLLSMNETGMRLLEIDDITPLLNTCWTDWWTTAHAPAARAVEAALAGGKGEFVAKQPTLAGTPKWWDVAVTPILGRDGKPERLLAVSRDITEQQQSKLVLLEARRRSDAALIAAEMGTFEWDAASERLTGDENFMRMFAFAAGTSPGIADLLSRVHPDDRDRLTAVAEKSLRRGEDFETEYRVGSPDRHRWFLSRGRVTRNAAGEVVRFPAVVIDVTDRKLIEQERERLLLSEKQMRETAEQASRLKDDFLATISHELRTPLNAIVGWATLIESTPVDPDLLAEGVEAISRNASAQSQLIEDILDVSRITSGKVRLNVRRIDLREPVEAAIATVSNSARAKGLSFESALGDAPVWVLGDPDRLQQVFWNLLANAIKFTDAGSIRVAIAGPPHRAVVSITDTGKGMDTDFLPYVFDRFRQADMSTTRRHGGLGLGLAIVRQLVELHGGTTAAHSDGPGRGSCFSVELPTTSESESAAEVEPAAPPRRAAEIDCPPLLENTRVLVIDDDVDGRRVVEASLVQCGAEVTVVGNVGDAIAVLTAGTRFDAILSDIGMPDEDGYAFLRRLRALETARHKPRLPVAALTAFTRPVDRTEALAAGFDYYLAKPITPALLIATVVKMIEVARKR